MSDLQHAVPQGYRFSAVRAGIKKSGRPDLALIVSDSPAACAGVFTRNRVVAAPVELTRQRIADGLCQAVLVNAGNANACTGEQGMQDARQCGALAAAALGVAEDRVAIASTGIIGVPLPMDCFERAVPEVAQALQPDAFMDVAQAIMTTDAFTKVASRTVTTPQGACRILGLAKGAGMIHPDMATMLAFVLTDAAVPVATLEQLLRQGVAQSFNAITVDGDTSTNDTVLLLANGASGIYPAATAQGAEAFAAALDEVLLELAKMIVRDGEGASKLVTIRIVGATDDAVARTVARSVATSSLVKCAFFGADPNWGRIIAAAGYSGAKFDPALVDIRFGEVLLAQAGSGQGKEAEKAAAEVLRQPEFTVTVDLHQGPGEASYYTSDLTYDYVRINAEYHT